MLTLDPNKRFTITDIINHKWFQQENDSVSSNFNSSSSFGSNSSSTSDYSIYQEFRNLIDKIEQMLVFINLLNLNSINIIIYLRSIKEFKPDESVLVEIAKYGINTEDVVKSVRNNEFDSYAGIYYLVEAKLNDTANLNNFTKYPNTGNRLMYQHDFISFNDAYDMTNINSTNDDNNNTNIINHLINKTSLNYTKCENNNFITNAQESSTISKIKISKKFFFI